MNISKVAEMSELTPVTLRYYEKVGLIPPINRKSGGVRDYSEEDLGWIEFIKCMRNAGLSIDSLINYTNLYQIGRGTEEERKEILKKEREQLMERYQEMGETLERLNYKIANYEAIQ
ncbi:MULTISPECIES: MerR family transcriptional regulator [Enterococcus]|uniref:MerR family transcriptional regulator n=1 Tax=Enterococcus alishanensis TaxID=1303817 RepID=A0ABS6TCG8_9ENTE|nr:MerR family transcriptional regulator [Enterococcus alishanensis]MBV7390605.1 MerR family transcriptional regulator [Enterococcus alishanensis]